MTIDPIDKNIIDEWIKQITEPLHSIAKSLNTFANLKKTIRNENIEHRKKVREHMKKVKTKIHNKVEEQKDIWKGLKQSKDFSKELLKHLGGTNVGKIMDEAKENGGNLGRDLTPDERQQVIAGVKEFEVQMAKKVNPFSKLKTIGERINEETLAGKLYIDPGLPTGILSDGTKLQANYSYEDGGKEMINGEEVTIAKNPTIHSVSIIPDTKENKKVLEKDGPIAPYAMPSTLKNKDPVMVGHFDGRPSNKKEEPPEAEGEKMPEKEDILDSLTSVIPMGFDELSLKKDKIEGVSQRLKDYEDNYAPWDMKPDENNRINMNLSYPYGTNDYIEFKQKQWKAFTKEHQNDFKSYLLHWTDIEENLHELHVAGFNPDGIPFLNDSPDEYREKATRSIFQEVSPNHGLYTFLRKYYLAENEYMASDSLKLIIGKTFVNGKHKRFEILIRNRIRCPECNKLINNLSPNFSFEFGIVCPHCKENVH